MSGTLPGAPSAPPPSGTGADPSMEDILASIRRILSEDEAGAEPARPSASVEDADVLALDASMLVEETSIADPPAALPQAPAPVAAEPVGTVAALSATPPVQPLAPPPVAAPEPPAEARADGLVAPAAAAAAASSLGSLVRTLAERQSLPVYRGGPTLEDIVREEMRPMLKAWLDENLPPLVERLVRAEIERVIGRAVS